MVIGVLLVRSQRKGALVVQEATAEGMMMAKARDQAGQARSIEAAVQDLVAAAVAGDTMKGTGTEIEKVPGAEAAVQAREVEAELIRKGAGAEVGLDQGVSVTHLRLSLKICPDVSWFNADFAFMLTSFNVSCRHFFQIIRAWKKIYVKKNI